MSENKLRSTFIAKAINKLLVQWPSLKKPLIKEIPPKGGITS